ESVHPVIVPRMRRRAKSQRRAVEPRATRHRYGTIVETTLCRCRRTMGDRWEHYEHDADVGVRGIGSTLARAFEQAGLALTAVVTDPEAVRCEQSVDITCEAPDAELLFAEWLNALVYEMAVRRLLFGRFEVRVDASGGDGELRLTAQAWGEPTSPARHAPAAEIKAATYTTLRVAQLPGNGWLAQTVVDV